MVVGLVIAIGGCSSGSSGGGKPAIPKLDRTSWTKAGTSQAEALAADIAKAVPGQCADAVMNDFAMFPLSMQRFESTVVPLGQLTCNVNDEVVEVTVLASAKDRDRYITDRSEGICRAAARQSKRYKQPLQIAGLRWVVGPGNTAVQPDSEQLARTLANALGGKYEGRQCNDDITLDWDPGAVARIESLGTQVAGAVPGCGSLALVDRSTLLKTRTIENEQLPIAVGSCPAAGATITAVTYQRPTEQVDAFVKSQTDRICQADPSFGRVDGDGFVILAPGTVAEQVATATDGKLSSVCG